MTQSRANVWRYPPGARGKRHADKVQEEVFVVVDGTLTVDLGEPPERYESIAGASSSSSRARSSSCATRATRSSSLFIYGAPPEQGGADFFDDVA